MQGRKLDGKTVNSMSVTSGMSRWDRETAAILAEDSAEEARTFKEDFYRGVRLRIGIRRSRSLLYSSTFRKIPWYCDDDLSAMTC